MTDAPKIIVETKSWSTARVGVLGADDPKFVVWDSGAASVRYFDDASLVVTRKDRQTAKPLHDLKSVELLLRTEFDGIGASDVRLEISRSAEAGPDAFASQLGLNRASFKNLTAWGDIAFCLLAGIAGFAALYILVGALADALATWMVGGPLESEHNPGTMLTASDSYFWIMHKCYHFRCAAIEWFPRNYLGIIAGIPAAIGAAFLVHRYLLPHEGRASWSYNAAREAFVCYVWRDGGRSIVAAVYGNRDKALRALADHQNALDAARLANKAASPSLNDEYL